MNTFKSLVLFFLVFGMLTCSSSETLAEDSLGDILRQSKWDRILGTWVDAETMGKKLKTTYAWRYEDILLEITTTDPQKESLALMGVKGGSDEVFHMGADSAGTSFLGNWKFKNGDAVLELRYTTGGGQQGGLKVSLHLQDDDTLIVSPELPQPTEVKMVRAKPSK